MKKLVLICFVRISAKGFSQEVNKKFFQEIGARLSYGLKAGTNYGNFINASFATDPLVGFQAGATIAFRMTDHWSTQETALLTKEKLKLYPTASAAYHKDDWSVAFSMLINNKITYAPTGGSFNLTSLNMQLSYVKQLDHIFKKKKNKNQIGWPSSPKQ